MFLSHHFSSFLGAWLGGCLYDQGDSYDPIWWLIMPGGLIATMLHWMIHEMPGTAVCGCGGGEQESVPSHSWRTQSSPFIA